MESWSLPPIEGKVHGPFLIRDARTMHFRASNAKKKGQKNFEPYLEPFVSPITHLSRPSRWAYYNVKSFNYLFHVKKAFFAVTGFGCKCARFGHDFCRFVHD